MSEQDRQKELEAKQRMARKIKKKRPIAPKTNAKVTKQFKEERAALLAAEAKATAPVKDEPTLEELDKIEAEAKKRGASKVSITKKARKRSKGKRRSKELSLLKTERTSLKALEAKTPPKTKTIFRVTMPEGRGTRDFESEDRARAFIDSQSLRVSVSSGVGKVGTSVSVSSQKINNNFIGNALVGLSNFITKYEPQGTLARLSNDTIDTINEARSDLGNILQGLKGLSNTFKAKGNFPTKAEVVAHFKDNPFAVYDIMADTPFTAKTIDEVYNRIGFAITEASLGGLIEFTLPISIGLAPPEDQFDVIMRLTGALATPSPIDFAVTKIASKLAKLGKKGRNLIRKWMTGTSMDLDELRQFEKIVGNSGFSTSDLRSGANELFDGIPLDDVGTASRKVDDILSDLAEKSDWSGGLDDAKVSSPLDQTKVVEDAQNQIKGLRSALDKLTDIDPDSNQFTRWGLLSPSDKTKLIKKYKDLVESWGNNPDLFGAGAAYEPESLVVFKDLLDDVGFGPDEYIDFLSTYTTKGKLVLDPASLTVFFSKLNDPVPKSISDPSQLTLVDTPLAKLDVITTLKDIPVEVPDITPDIVPDIIEEDEIITPIPIITVIEEPVLIPEHPGPTPVLEPPEQKQDEILIPVTVQKATTAPKTLAEERAGRGGRVEPISRRPRIKRRAPAIVSPPKIPSFPKGTNFKVRFRTFIGGEIVRVSAKNFRDAEIKAERLRKDQGDIIEVEVTRL